MRCARCGSCCQETDMMLSVADITRLERLGYEKDTFVRFDKDRYALLRNRQGYCVFYNTQEHRCEVYSSRPSGCRVYPVILDEEKGIVVDSICRAKETISKSEKSRRGRRVVMLLEQIDEESQARRR